MSMLLTKALNLGVIDTALNWLIKAITDLLMWLVNWTIDLVVTIFAGLLYEIGLTLLSIVDFFQAFFNALCGMGTYWTQVEADDGFGAFESFEKGGFQAHVKEDPIFGLITNKSVLQVMLALGIVAIILLIMTTVIAMIRTEYTTEGAKNTKGNIIGSALKSLAMFFLVPAFCVFGIILSNTLLQMVYIATSGGENVSAGAMVWYASSYNANKVRLDDDFYNEHWGTSADVSNDEYSMDFQIAGTGNTHRESVAAMIDLAFKNGSPISKSSRFHNYGSMSESVADLITGGNSLTFDGGVYSYRNVGLTREFYSLRDMNFIVMYLGGGIAVYIMFIAAFGLIIRMYKCAVLFMVSAPVQALTPLDGGNAFKNWRKLMIGSVCAAFSVVIAFNLMFLLIPVVGNINIFNPKGFTAVYWNRLVNMIFVLTGLYSIKETSKWVANMLGIEDPLAAGSEIAGKVMGTVSKVATMAGSGGLAMGANVMKFGTGLASKIQANRASHATGEQKEKLLLSSKRLNAASTATGNFASKVGGVGAGVLQKTIGKQMTRFDDFAGGANIFGGLDDKGNPTGLQKHVSKAAGKLYSVATDLPSAAVSGAGRVAGAVHGVRQRHQQMEEYRGMQQTIASGGTLTDAQKERFVQLRDEHNKGAITGTLQAIGKGQADGAKNFTNATNAGQYWATIDQGQATFNRVQEYAQTKSDNVNQYVAAAITAAGVHGNFDNDQSREAATKIAELLGESLDTVMNALKGNTVTGNNGTYGSADDLRAKGSEELSILANYHFEHDVNMNGFNPDAIPFSATSDHTSDEIANIISRLLEANGAKGANISAKLESVMNTIKAEQDKAAAEARKESEKINQLAAAIAKMSKKLNPPKK